MKLASNNESLAEGKVIILYILDKIAKPVSNNALLKIVSTLTDMNYFYFQQFLLDVETEKYVLKYILEGENDFVYELTKEGKETLALISDIIPGITKLRIDSNLKENLDEVKEELSITADFIPHSEIDYSVKCKITENNITLFEIQTFAGSREQAKEIVDNWNENAIQIYPKLLEILTDKEE